MFKIINQSPRYNALIFEAISALKEPNGSDVSAILSYIEVQYNFHSHLFLYQHLVLPDGGRYLFVLQLNISISLLMLEKNLQA